MMTPFTVKPTLTGELVVLRPVHEDDAEVMVEIFRDPDVARLTGSIHRSDESGDTPLATAREWYGSRGDADDRLDLAVVDRASGEVVGETVLNGWSPQDLSANFRILIGPRGRGCGLGTEATRLTLAHGFEQIGLHRVSLEVFAFNPRARRVYEKVGFVHEGTRRDALRFDDAWVDAHDMAILAPEWARHRGRPDSDHATSRERADDHT